MVKGGIKALLVTFLAVSLVLPFSISSFATGYDFEDMGDRDRETFSGTNDVYTNGIHISGSGTNIVFDTIMENSNNTYNGTSNINATAYPADSYDTGSTYNGTLNVDANDISTGVNQVNSATVNANTSVQVNDVLSDNSLNAGVQFNDSNFTGDVTLSGSGSVNLAGSTVNNLILGDIPQFQTLLDYQNKILSRVAIIWDNIASPVVTSSSGVRNLSFMNSSYSYTMGSISIGGTTYYCTFSGLLRLLINQIIFEFNPSGAASYSDGDSDPNKLTTFNGLPVLAHLVRFNVYSYNSNTDVVSYSLYYRYNSFAAFILNAFSWSTRTYIESYISYLADTWYRWYSPNISASDSQFWIAFNTDTEVYDHVNLSTVFGYITWYLGQLYIQGNEAAADISDSVEDMATAFTDLETKENQINSSIKNSLNSVDSFFNLPAIASGSVVIGWLQYMWVSLGIFQGVTIIAWALIILTIVTGFYKVKRITV